MVFCFAFILGIIFDNVNITRAGKIIIALMFICMIFVSAHKFSAMHNYTSGVHNYLITHKSDFINTPSKIFVYFIEDIPEEGYASYKYPMGHGLHYGYAFKSLWNWEPEVKINKLKNFDQNTFKSDSLPEYDTVLVLTQSGNLKILRN